VVTHWAVRVATDLRVIRPRRPWPTPSSTWPFRARSTDFSPRVSAS
jgi:hypothetical protein